MVGTTMAWVTPSRRTVSIQVAASNESRYSGDVVRRNGHQRGLVGLGAGELDGADHVRSEMAVSQQRGLRGARCTRGVQDDRHVLGVDEAGQFDVATRDERILEEVLALDGHRRIGAGNRPEFGDDDGARVGLDQRTQLFLAQAVVERDERKARVRGREEGDGERRAVGSAEHDARGAHVEELRGGPTGRGIQFGEGEGVVAGDDRGTIVEGRRCHLEEQGEIHGGWTADQSEEGRGLAPLIGTSRPSAANAPGPGLAQSTSRPDSSSA
jgi:hypothetical protein